jgi:trigger factor
LQITQEQVVDRQTVLRIELEDSDLDPYLERGYRRLVQKANIPGFRKGKAPRQIVEQYFGKEGLLQEVLEYTVSDVTSKAIESQKLDASGLPKVELVDLKPVVVKATVPLTPDVDLGAYKDIRVPLKPIEVTEEQVNERVERVRGGQATWEPVERPAQMGDLVTGHVVGIVGGQKWIDQVDAVFVLDKEGNRPIPGFSEAVAGAEKGVAKEFSLVMPKDYSDAKLAGREGKFTITASEVKQRNLPALDDEFAKGVGEGYETLAALREAVRKELTTEAEAARDAEYREEVLKALVAGAKIALPPLLVEHEAEHVIEDRQRALARLNVRLEDYLLYSKTTVEKLQEESKQSAQERLTRAFAMRKFADLEQVAVSDDDVAARVTALKEQAEQVRARANQPAKAGKRDELDSDEAKESIKRTVVMERAMEKLVAIAKGEAPQAASA